MAGNTKLIGFLSGNRVVLERWGGRTEVELSSTSVRLLTDAVREELPTEPPKKKELLVPEFYALFNPASGKIDVSMDAEIANRLHEGWESKWLTELKKAVQARQDYFDRDEPGLT